MPPRHYVLLAYRSPFILGPRCLNRPIDFKGSCLARLCLCIMRCARRTIVAPAAFLSRPFATQSSAPPRPSKVLPNRSAVGPDQRPSPKSQSSAERRTAKRREKRDGSPLSAPAPFVIIGSQTVLHTLQTNPSTPKTSRTIFCLYPYSAESVEEIVIDQEKMKNPRIATIAHLAQQAGIEVKEATKARVQTLSKNPRQDQVRIVTL